MNPLGAGQFIFAPGVQADMLFGLSGYACLYADPPWQFATYSAKGRGRSPDNIERTEALPLFDVDAEEAEEHKHYPTMPTDEICALNVAPLAAQHSVLYLWATTSMISDAMRVVDAWGFKHATTRVWIKTLKDGYDPARSPEHNYPMGTGYIARGNPELLLICTRGKPKFKRPVHSLIIAPRRDHSRKPDQVRADIERQVAGPYLELFARTQPPGWSVWGNQVERFEAA